ncbi:MAG TPA: M28 family peptidase, partial [Acidobacteriota bacterium]|nr:M28 family peptidase [Acidobacteriota bacterium]
FFLQGSTLPDLPDNSLRTIDADELRMHIEFLASPELGGRYTLSPQLGVVNRYLASRLRGYGFQGADEGSFFQEYRVRRAKPDAQTSRMSLTTADGQQSYEYAEFVSQGPATQFEGQVVFVGYGISDPATGRDDYAQVDLQGKVAFALAGAPEGMDDAPEMEERAADALKAGAVGFIATPPQRFLRFIRSPMFKRFILRRDNVELAGSSPDSEPTVIVVTPKSAGPLLSALDLDFESAYKLPADFNLEPRALDVHVKVELDLEEEVFTVANVAGVLPGTDPRLKDEYILISAHQDHLKARDDGTIFPGADDDASGVAAVLEIAQSFAAYPPRRSVLIMFHSGEEEGLLGSRYNTDIEPLVPLDSIVANINLDMIGRSKEDERMMTGPHGVFVIGADRISQDLHDINVSTNQDYNQLDFDYTLNDPSHPSRLYYRSDHWNYGKHDVPFIFFFSGIHEDYHRPSDTIDKIDWQKATIITRHIFALAWRLANMEERVTVNSR